ncbi:response regulator [Pigmentibacter sp. JX0631]|uniref:response regulator n=1 Tax=Pigmentibacter sp. JX0631 TaxID=2976982 RepID=UPI002468E0D4|nr:response regulator [Pigmentibacter sp. JX0631]WGL61456.1 response regulator [Pigmentibacter sp. JX0631]
MKQVLIVDDNKDIVDVIKEELFEKNLVIITSNNGKDAFEIIKNNSIDFVISDIRMPDGDGVELLRNINSLKDKKPKIILMTGFAEISKEEALKNGCYAFLKKPLDWEELSNLADKLLKE